MGVPKFYRWISERYPCLSEVVKEYQIPEFDNLYLDMNGIVHVCSHPEDDNPHFRITEEKIFNDIFHYIEVLYRLIKPKGVFFMAIDGVAPRAKMNQQRGRRFRSAREAEDLVKKALEKGEVLPTETRFDSNCITPGTPFMVKLQEQLKYFVVNKITNDKLWQGPRIYLSGHETPGEGEHKVMDFIRYEKSKSTYDPNTRHCLYGLDADLIMLGMVSHEPHFSLLREEVRFGSKNQKQRATTAEETTFHLLHLQLLREYLDFEFSDLRGKLPFEYDLDKIIDDWVLMGFLVGNDFIPHLPNLHIHADALPTLWATYKAVLPTLDGYLNEGGNMNLQRFEKFMKALSAFDESQFQEIYADLKWMESKVGGKHINERAGAVASKRDRRKGKGKGKKFATGTAGIPTANEFVTLMNLDDDEHQDDSNKTDEQMSLETDGATAMTVGDMSSADSEVQEEEEEEIDVEDEDKMFHAEFKDHKGKYYMEKMHYRSVTKEVLKEQAYEYVKALQWILHYYYNGVPSWGWFYPFHYAPFLSDVRDFANMKIEYDYGTPFLPFQQLMAVLPAASKNLLPPELQVLMISEGSPILDFYPVKFETDLNGKRQDWEAVVLIPFIAENRLLEAMAPAEERLSPPDKARNIHGPHLLYQYNEEPLGTFTTTFPGVFPDIVNHKARLTTIPLDGFVVDSKKLKKGLCEGVRLDVYFPGFPTMKHLKHTAQLKKEGVKVFQMNSRGENMMVSIVQEEEPVIDMVARELLGKPTYVGWPHLSEARVVEVADDTHRYYFDEGSKHLTRTYDNAPGAGEIIKEEIDSRSKWHKSIAKIAEDYHDKKGIEVGTTGLLLKACPMTGRKYVCGQNGSVTLEKQWSEKPMNYVYQATVKDIAVKAPLLEEYKTIDLLFPVQSEVFMLGSPHYGSMGSVLNIDPKNEGRIRVSFTVAQQPNLERIRSKQGSLQLHYMPGYILAQRLGISSHLLSRMTGTVYITRGSRNKPMESRINVGLNLKQSKKNEEVPGYTKRTEEGQWQYSSKTLQILDDYISRFEELFEYITTCSEREDAYYEEDIFQENSATRTKELTTFLKELPCANATRMKVGSLVLDELVIKEIEKECDRVDALNKTKKRSIKMQVRPHLLYRPLDAQNTLVPDVSTTYELFDRIVNVRDGYSVPLGLTGTIVGIYTAEKEQDIVYEVVFDEAFMGGLNIRCTPGKGYRMAASAMIDITYGERKTQEGSERDQKPTAVVKPQTSKTRDGASRGYAADGMNRSNNCRNSDRQNGARNKHSQQHQGDEMFKNVWSQLQKGDSASNKPHNHNSRNPKNSRNEPSLQQAANALESVQTGPPGGRNKEQNWRPNSGKQHHRQSHSSDKKSHHEQQNLKIKKKTEGIVDDLAENVQSMDIQSGQKVDLNALFVKASEKSKDMTTLASQSNQIVSDEFSNNMKVLENADVSKGTSVHELEQSMRPANTTEGTAALCQMLKIGQSKPEGEENVASKLGRQVSLQELFDGAKQQPQVPVVKPQPSASGHQGAEKRNIIKDLYDTCKTKGLLPPKYDYQDGNNDRVCATVSLSNNMKFMGSYAKSQEQAAESAARKAVKNLNQHTNPPPLMMPVNQNQNEEQSGQQQLSPRFCTSPNSAFTPVRGKPQFVPQGPYPNRPMPQNVPMHGGQRYPHRRPNMPPPGPHMGQMGFPPQLQGPNFFQRPPGQHMAPPPHHHGHGPPPGGHHGNQFHQGQHRGPMHHHHQGHGNFSYGQHQSHGYHHDNYNKGNFEQQQQQHHHQQHKRQQHHQQQQHGHQSQHVQQKQPAHEKPQESTENVNGKESQKDNNPFVPLQVQRKSKTPQKSLKPEDDIRAVEKTSEHSEQVTHSIAKSPSEKQSKREGKEEARKNLKQTTPRKDQETSKKQHSSGRKQKSRLAANFGGGGPK